MLRLDLDRLTINDNRNYSLNPYVYTYHDHYKPVRHPQIVRTRLEDFQDVKKRMIEKMIWNLIREVFIFNL